MLNLKLTIISKYENIFAEGYKPNYLGKAFLIKKFKSTVPWTYKIQDLHIENKVQKYCCSYLKSNFDKLDIEKIRSVATALSKISNE